MRIVQKAKDWFKSKVTLVDNWKQVLRRAYTVWFAVGSVMFGSIEYWHADFLSILPIFSPILPEKVAGAISLVLTAAIPFVRIKKQIQLAIAEAGKAP